MLPNSHLITALPFVDQELDNVVPKSKVSYLIKSQQQEMNKKPEEYIATLLSPELSYVDTEEF